MEYGMMGREMQLRKLRTEPGHRRMDVASSMFTYLKTRGCDMTLVAEKTTKHFYKKMGFEPYGIEEGAMKLPEGKQLALRPFEKKVRKFLIAPEKRVQLSRK